MKAVAPAVFVVGLLVAAAAAAAPQQQQQSPDPASGKANGWWSPKSRHYYWKGCKSPCTSNPRKWRHPRPQYPKPDPANPQVLSCPPGYGRVQNIVNLADTAYAEYSGNNVGAICIPCESGFYSPGGSSACLSCASGTTNQNTNFITPQGASSAAQCICAPGFGGPGCLICPPSTFSPGGGLGDGQNPQPACQICPDTSKGSSKPGAISRMECGGCNPGFGGLGCRPCPAGKYNTGGDYSACKSCGPNQSSPPQSPGVEFCACTAGHGLSPKGACALCPLGTFWPGPAKTAVDVGEGIAAAAAAAVQKQKRKAALSSCLSCSLPGMGERFTTLQQGATSVDACVCQPGYGGKLCSFCPAGTYSPGGTTAACVACGGFGTTQSPGSTSPTQCGCQAGSGGANCHVSAAAVQWNGSCCLTGHQVHHWSARCPANTYSPGGSQVECSPCPINTVAPPGSGRLSACVPKPGFGSVNGSVTPCPLDTWSAGGENVPCTACPDNTVSPSTSTNSNACVCLPGFKPDARGCVQCVSGEICPGGASGGAAVVQCPPGATSPPGSDSPADCVCQPGYGGGNCDLCAEGFWSAGNSKAACQACDLGQTSPGGSVSAAACVCVLGRGGSSCAECPTGTFSMGGTTDPCTSCPDGTTTVSTGNDNPSDCICSQGFAGPFCTACMAGEICPGGGRLSPVVCPANSEAPVDATTVQQCVCKAGYGRPANSSLGCTTCPICEACPVGSFSSGGSTDSCIPCGRGSTTMAVGSLSVSACVCAPGFGGASCTQCPANTYSGGFSLAACVACPATSTSPAGSTSSSACVCQAGFGGPTCAACPAGTFSTGGTSAAPNAPCTRCGNSGSGFTTNPTTSPTSDNACVCKPGFGGSGCASCPANTFGTGGSTDPCVSCPAGTVSTPNAQSATDCKASVCPAGQQLSSGADNTQVACVCKPGFGSGSAITPCTICPQGTFSLGGSFDACLPCGFGLTSAEGTSTRDDCVASKLACPSGMGAAPGAVSTDECACLPGFGVSGSGPGCALCPVGSWSAGLSATDVCTPCAFGTTSPAGSSSAGACYATNSSCPVGMWIPTNTNVSSSAECVCKPGFGTGLTGDSCHQCPVGTYSTGSTRDPCLACPFGTTSAAGSDSRSDCVASPTACPPGMSAPPGAASAAQCSCLAGWGTSGSTLSCSLCPVGSYSIGGTVDPCTPCGFGRTSPAGSIDDSFCYNTNQCPPGTQPPAGVIGSSPAECICRPGFGGNVLGTLCAECPPGTFSPGTNRDACLTCPFGTSSGAGTTTVNDCRPVAQECPAGMAAPADATSAAECGCLAGHGVVNSSSSSAGCAVCPVGTYSPGGTVEACIPCGFGVTSLAGSSSQSDCYPLNLVCPPGMVIPGGGVTSSSIEECQCKPGFGGPAVPQASPFCTLCPVGTFSPGGNREQCRPCPFGTTSAPGSDSSASCVASPTECPPGQIAPPTAVSSSECSCLPGFGWTGNTVTGSCQICPVGWYGTGVGLQPCLPCGFGSTSSEGSDAASDCYPVDQCPVGMYVISGGPSDPPSSAAECICKPGHGGNLIGTACFLCPAGTFGTGDNGRAPCTPCSFGFIGPAGSSDSSQCTLTTQACPNGQGPFGDPQNLDSELIGPETCACLPGYGGGAVDKPCQLCPPGTFSIGYTWEECKSCPAGTFSVAGAADIVDCITSPSFCPPGMYLPTGVAQTKEECTCVPGFGTVSPGSTAACSICPAGTFSEGNALQPCATCGSGLSGPPGAKLITECQNCPPGTFGRVINGSGTACQTCPPGTTTVFGSQAAFESDCNLCIPGFGFGANGACQQCPAGTYSPGGSTSCVLCPLGMSSAPGSNSTSGCFCNVDGYGSAGGNSCIACPKGSYSAPDRGVNQCEACAAGQTTLLRPGQVGASSITQCVCDAGYGTPPGASPQCAACISPFYQGVNRSTTATIESPFPPCVQCTDVPASQVTGDVNGLCTFNTNTPSAYCASATATPPACGPP
eukprot:gene7566-biopygen9370